MSINDSKKSFKTNMDNSFRDYMRQKIELQRKQIGLVLPAPLPHSDEYIMISKTNTPNNRSAVTTNPNRDLEEGTLAEWCFQHNMESVATPKNNDIHQRHAEEDVNHEKEENSPSSELGIQGVVSRLQKKHGTSGCKSKLALAKRKRQKKEASSLISSPYPQEIYDGEQRDDDARIDHSPLEIDDESLHIKNKQSVHQTSPSKALKVNESMDSITTRNRPDLFFLNTIVLINGYTNPPNDSLMRMLQRHGGDVEKYETDRVTQIIAEQLSSAKAKIFKKQRKPIPVVHPRWITESVKAGRKLPYSNYLLEQVRFHETHEMTMKHFLANASLNKNAEKECNNDLVRAPSIIHPPSPPVGVIRTVGNDPTFLESYFASSRLSFIGSFKQRIKPHGHTKSNDDSILHTDVKGSRRFVLHIDMDYFFAAVAIRNFPQYKEYPVAIGHRQRGDDTESTSELSTCNYIARQYGVQKGMFLKRARELCPNLVVLPYDYEGYEEVSNQVGDILQQYADNYYGVMEHVSCDEAYLEIYISELEDIITIGGEIRQKISEDTKCTASIGIAENKLMAKLATNKIKPDGLLLINDSATFLQGVSMSDLPGIGYQLGQKLQTSNLKTVQNVLDLGDDDSARERILQEIVGPARAKKLVIYCKGEDDRNIKPVPRKTIGAECNYGVRFDDAGPYGVDYMIAGLAKEVERRMLGLNLRGRLCTLKLKERKANAPPPGKYNGCGSCIDHSKSAPLPFLTNDSSTITQVCMKLVQQISVPKEEIRGIGIVISKLENYVEDDGIGTVSNWLKHGQHGFNKYDEKKNPPVKKSSNENSSQSLDMCECDVIEACEEVILDHSKLSTEDKSTSSTHKFPILAESYISKSVPKKRSFVQPKKKNAIKTKKPKHVEGVNGIQTSMLSIMKLASMKSRRDEIKYNGETISLTQLDCLPLELQLEVTNSTSEKNNPFHHSSYGKQNKPSSGSQGPEKNIPYKSSLLLIEERVQTYKQSLLSYTSSIAPFRTFLQSNTSPDIHEVQRVKDFLCTCISERRHDEAVQLLRILKRNCSSWGSIHYHHILEASNAHLLTEEGRVFDKEWLGL